MLNGVPAFGVCGWSNSGKTTLIEKVAPLLRANGLKVLVLKHDVHGLQADRPTKDSDRLFCTGADVLAQAPGEQLLRARREDAEPGEALRALSRHYDLVLVEGYKNLALPKVWLLKDGEAAPPESVGNVLAAIRDVPGRAAVVMTALDRWLAAQWAATPVCGCILIGGRSSRMGSPKHLLPADGKTWLERTAGLLGQVVAKVAIVGPGDVPARVAEHVRLPDAPDAEGPMAGILAAMRWNPRASWLVVSCDLPQLSTHALRWLLSSRVPGVWATLPRLADRPAVEPLLAHYDFRARALLEELAARGDFSPGHLASSVKVITPTPPAELASAWVNVNTPAELVSLGRQSGLHGAQHG